MPTREMTHKEFLDEQLKDPAFREAWEASEPAYQLRRLRILKKLSQAELARRVGTKQPSIARLESGQAMKNLTFLRKVAAALDAEVEIRLKPKAAAAGSARQPTPSRQSKPRKKKIAT